MVSFDWFCFCCPCLEVCANLLQSCATLCDFMDCRLPGSSVPGNLQARILEWTAMEICPKNFTKTAVKEHIAFLFFEEFHDFSSHAWASSPYILKCRRAVLLVLSSLSERMVLYVLVVLVSVGGEELRIFYSIILIVPWQHDLGYIFKKLSFGLIDVCPI